MKKFFTILGFEVDSYIKNKAYMISTIGIAVLLVFIMFLPSMFDMSEFLGIETAQEEVTEEIGDKNETEREEQNNGKLVFYDKAGIGIDTTVLESAFADNELIEKESAEAVKEAVEKEEAEAGFVVTSPSAFDYYVVNNGMYDMYEETFRQVMTVWYRQSNLESLDMDYQTIEQIYQTQIESEQHILGKDVGQNFWYCYVLVIIIFMMIIMYGVMIATSVTSEKSNRSIEVLITSAPPDCLLFGKVIAGAIAGLFQTVVIMASILIPYQINRDAWGGTLDILLNIPSEVLITFLVFGLGGFLFYAFIYGAVGAMVSKTEDINRVSGGVQMVIMLVYFAVLMQLENPEGIIMKVASYLPVSSYSAMFIRVAMGTVKMWEVAFSFIILIISIIGTGFLGAKIYRLGTLRYGNPIKFTQLFKMMKK